MGHPRTALVTGGMGGLGEAIARTLHDAGHTVLVTHSRSDEAASTWLKKEADAGYTFVSYDVDVSDWISCRRMGQRIVADGHGVNILVNNAGITRDATFRKLSKENWDAVLRVNLDSMFNVTKLVIDGMLERGWAGSSTFPRSTATRANSARPTTPPPKPASMASPRRWHRRSPAKA